MANSIQNVVMQGASGKIGKTLVFRQMRNGETRIANRPMPRSTPLTPDQEAFRERFSSAAYLAKSLVADPILAQQYRAKAKPGQTAYNVAMRDCLIAPQIKSINLEDYSGAIGNVISIWAVDDFKLVSVKLRLLQSDDTLIEAGDATLDTNGRFWTYAATAINAALSGTKVEVTASDIPGNKTVEVSTVD